jgi:putative membrane-bound dehydrogenase-like protein
MLALACTVTAQQELGPPRVTNERSTRVPGSGGVAKMTWRLGTIFLAWGRTMNCQSRTWGVSCFLVVVGWLLQPSRSPAGDQPAGTLRAGAAAVDVNPTLFPVRVNGMVEERTATGAVDVLMSRAIVLDDGKEKLAIVVVDNLMMPRALLDDAKERASQATGIPTNRMLISATHTHSAPSAMSCLGSRVDPAYAEFLPGQIARSIIEASKSLQPAEIGWTVITDEKHNHCRRWIFRPDRMIQDPFGDTNVRAHMHPGYQSPNHIGPSGPADTDLTLVSIRTLKGQPLAVLGNYAMHYYGTPLISGDVCGHFGAKLGELIGVGSHGSPFVGVLSQGTSGDSMWMDYSLPAPKIDFNAYVSELAQVAFEGYQKIEYQRNLTLAMAETTLKLSRRLPSEERLKWARAKVAEIGDRLPRGWTEVYAFEAIDLHNTPAVELKLQAIRIGSMGITALPDEVYGITGLKLKGRSPLQPTMNIELANGAEGYIPPPEQHKLGGYTTWPAKTAGLEVTAETQITAKLLELLEQVAGQPKRVLSDPPTEYSKAVVASKPAAFWRLGEIDGTQAADSVGDSHGLYEDGTARYLPGAEGDGLKQAPRGSRAAQFVGGRVAVKAASVGDDYSIEGWVWNGLPNDARPVTGYLFSRGPGGDQKAPGDHVGIGGMYEDGKWQGKLLVFNGNERNEALAGRSVIGFRTWNHVVFTRQGTKVRVYLNGQPKPEIEGDLPLTYQSVRDQFFLGGRGDGMFGLVGRLDEVALFGRALTGEEVTAHYLASGNPLAEVKEPKTDSPPLSPEESMKRIHVREGYELQLVAAEPLVMDPVAIDWGADGKLWVAEMADYPNGMDDKGQPGGRIRYLEDKDGDGKYETSTLFLDGVSFPNGVMAWNKGVLVTAAPEIFYAEDTNGDGKCDVRTVLYSGFLEGNQQLRVNGLRWGLDNWVYCASGSHVPGYGADSQILTNTTGARTAVGSRDFRIRPLEGLIEPESGPSQFGRNRDDWGHWYGEQNSYPLWHYVLEDQYLRRNPHFAAPDPRNQVITPANPPVYPATPPEKRFHSFEQAGRFTSACSGMIYQDDLLFDRSPDNGWSVQHSFTCEPFSNLVQHNVILADSVSYRFERDPAEAKRDFFASGDRWCRPVMARTGPDGALWVVDMYRYMIEHPQWLPKEGQDELRPFFREGEDKGRIYRIVPVGKKPRRVPKFDELNTSQLVETLESSNAWQRDMAQRLLVSRQDLAAVEPLQKLTTKGATPQARLQALCTLEGLGALTTAVLTPALQDPHPGVRSIAVRLASACKVDSDKLEALASDPDPKVRLQLAFTLGDYTGATAGRALARLAIENANEPFIQAAVMSSLNKNTLPDVLSAIVDVQQNANAVHPADAAVARFFGQAAAIEDVSRMTWAVQQTCPSVSSPVAAWQLASLAMWLDSLHGGSVTLQQLASADRDRVNTTLDRARTIVADPEAPDALRCAAAALLFREPDKMESDRDLLASLLTPRTPAEVQQAIVEQVAGRSDPALAMSLLSGWKSHAPSLRTQILSVVASRKEWLLALVDQLENQSVSASEIDATLRERLLTTRDEQLRERLKKVLQVTASADRQQVLKANQPVLKLTGDVARGQALFGKKCTTCHKQGETGHAVGPNLASLTTKSPESLLLAILDPSAAVEGKYLNYVAVTTAGRSLTGILATETGSSITLLAAEGKSEAVLRDVIEELRSTSKSLMPDGLEKDLSQQDIADLIEFVRSLK